MAYQTMDIEIKRGWGHTSKEIQKGLDEGNEKGWKLHTCIQTVSNNNIIVYLLVWETE